MKKILLSSLLLFFSIHTFSQGNYIDFQATLGITGGYTPDGFAGNINFNYILADDHYLQGGLYMSFSDSKYLDYKIPYTIASLNAGYFVPVLMDNRQTLKLALGGGLVLGYELINNGDKEMPNGALIESNSNFIYGGFVSGEFDISITRSIWAVAKYNHYYHLNSDVGNLTLYAGAGLRFFL